MNKEIIHCPSLVDVVRLRAQNTPNQVSCTFINKDLEEKMTYSDLDQHARAIAAMLQKHGAQPGDRILLLFSPGFPFIKAFFGCLYAGCIAVPIHPPAQKKLLEKAHRIISNAKPTFAIMTLDHVIKFSDSGPEEVPHIDQIPCLTIDTIKLTQSLEWKPPKVNRDTIAFLQYTSGSTMHPKGVIVSHNNLLDNSHKIYHAYAMSDETIFFSWLPPHHDMGLIGCILTPIYGGFPVFMMSPFSFLQNPLSWLQNISKYRATISGSPNFAYDYCVKRIKEEKKQGLDLSSWGIAFNGAEPIRKETLEHFYHAFKDYGFKKNAFYPCYGLAEATLFVTGHTAFTPYNTLTLAKEHYQDHRVRFAEEGSPQSHSLVGCGKLIQTVKIVDPDTLSLCTHDQVGEIWVQSDSVAHGYWEQEKETKHAFHGKIQNDATLQEYLRTGDLGFIHDEELYVTGRLKDLIILYGKNHYPQDIEYSILHHPIHKHLGKCAAFVIQADHEYELTVMCEVKNRFMETEEQDMLFNTIFELVYQTHQLEIHHIVLTPLKSMPHTTSGKIRRNFCRQHLLDNTLPVVATWKLNKVEG
ncbi:fatty acyl-AMP ligase [Legionella longbeachae]|uniref:Putative acyl-CoA synthetase n=1 Tax=Legionella longbeachae serogroup 1 (strain NSW150) TaxID=661367 RepID=D3HKR5_LEGLN|nr:fatty acyl-AMP ligase [Legionella longbeachae]VEE03545.1 acyl-CoA synthetase [Legionella oakridgensis]ARB93568.1 fatty acyl-AMP ligase [Legionella longbeachae]ARM33295.1 fatty acyl-AMP ligase [Legionella longbeachae]EEZ93839.1 putative AMP-dependent synthetase and ligase [Legionella longbeachae D-4968]QIN33246.1 AMP-binding protein [Legionella longbeachae]